MINGSQINAAVISSSILTQVVQMIICFASFGFIFPNAFIQGLDLTAIQRQTEGSLYDSKSD